MKVTNSIVWLDLRSEDLNLARRFIKLMEGEGVLDELGFLALQARFADTFYPATSVLMSAPRYLYFLAGIYRQLEREYVPGMNVQRESRRRMDRLRAILAQNEKHGVIGKEAKERVKQWPSDVYWASLKHLGLFGAALSERAYQDRAFSGRASAIEDDDGVSQVDERVTFWASDAPDLDCLDAGGEFAEETSFRLSRAEARDLFSRYKDRYPGSLLVHLVAQRAGELQAPWDAPRPSSALKAQLEQGRLVSLLARGATLQYFDLLNAARSAKGLSPGDFDVEDHFAEWWKVAGRPLKSWAVRDGLCSLPSIGADIRQHLDPELAFMQRWQERLVACGGHKQLLRDSEARALVKKREMDVKKVKSRFRSHQLLERWAVDPRRVQGAYQFEYRHGVGSWFAQDIQKALYAR